MRLILASESKAFPPRLPHQPLFYPVLNYEYAEQIARDWNTKDMNSGFAGFVTEFKVSEPFIRQFEEHRVGASTHRELWIPAERLDEFNQNIDGRIELKEAFYGEGYKGLRHWYKDWYADEIFVTLQMLESGYGMDFNGEIAMNRNTILLNFKYWIAHDYSEFMADEQKLRCLNLIQVLWQRKNPDILLIGSDLVK